MFAKKSEVESLVEHLNKRKCFIYHACQYKDFQSYLTLGGVPSRALLTSQGIPFTGFASDKQDKVNGVWDRIFFNLSDAGHWFHRTTVSKLPNAFGPILFVLKPEVLLGFKDVAICLRSAGAEGFNRVNESLISVEEVNELFIYPANHPKYPDAIKFDDLERMSFVKTRKLVVSGVPEISCSSHELESVGSFSEIHKIEVDPVNHEGETLHPKVWAELQKAGIYAKCWQRTSKRSAVYNDLLSLADRGVVDLKKAITDTHIGTDTQKLLQNYLHGRDWMYERFSLYMKQGTLEPIVSQAKGRTTA